MMCGVWFRIRFMVCAVQVLVYMVLVLNQVYGVWCRVYVQGFGV